MLKHVCTQWDYFAMVYFGESTLWHQYSSWPSMFSFLDASLQAVSSSLAQSYYLASCSDLRSPPPRVSRTGGSGVARAWPRLTALVFRTPRSMLPRLCILQYLLSLSPSSLRHRCDSGRRHVRATVAMWQGVFRASLKEPPRN